METTLTISMIQWFLLGHLKLVNIIILAFKYKQKLWMMKLERKSDGFIPNRNNVSIIISRHAEVTQKCSTLFSPCHGCAVWFLILIGCCLNLL